MLENLDFLLKICAEARQELGEDNWCHAFCAQAGMIAVFDGCGGSGARKHEFYTGHSEAYMASRLCAGAFFNAFLDTFEHRPDALPDEALARCEEYCRDVFAAYRPPAGQRSRLKSAMLTTLPTTAAAAFFRLSGRKLHTTAAWAGDSRIYVLTPHGLSQITTDDSENPDPYETDSMMINTLNADRLPRINRKFCTFPLPAIVLSATDGCFAYYTTPMEFEGVLLSTLLSADSPATWESALTREIGGVAGDDYSLILASFGFETFEMLKQKFVRRYKFLYENYLKKISALSSDDAASRRLLWEKYRPKYMRYLEERN